jgi:DNA-binding protein H-NS
MATLKTVQAQIAKLQAQANSLMAKQSSAVLEQIRDLMSEHGLTTADIDAHIGGKKRGPKPGEKAVVKTAGTSAKYRDPKSGATWSGRGPAPAWLAGAKDRTKFLIEGAADTALAQGAGTVSNAKSAAKKSSAGVGAVAHKGQPKGPQPAKYRDPMTGASWSGRGPAPAWLAVAKDRSKFLIDTVGAVAVSAGSASKANPAAKTVVAKKPAAKKAVSAKAPVKKAAAKKAVPTASKKASGNNAPMTEAALASPSATVESGAESTS